MDGFWWAARSRLVWTLGVTLWAALVPGRAWAEVGSGCRAAQNEWVSRCAATHGFDVHAYACPPGALIVRVASDPPMRFELSREADRGFVQAAGVAISPIGNFARWSDQPLPHRQALQHLTQCVETDPTLAVPQGQLTPHTAAPTKAAPRHHADSRSDEHQQPPLPWLLLGACICIFFSQRSWPVHDRLPRREWMMAIGLCLATMLVWVVRQPFGFFHQNGHGGLWVEYALNGHPGLAAYGPGYRELFGWVANIRPEVADRVVFAAQLLLASLSPLSLWILARAVGLSLLPTATVAAFATFDPLWARLATSESYFTAILSLLLLAAAVLARCTHKDFALRQAGGWLGCIGAGLLVAQAARIHPLAWIPAATVPAVVLAARGSWRRTIFATTLIAATVAVCAGPAIYNLLEGTLGQAWMPSLAFASGPPVALAILIPCVTALVGFKRWQRHRGSSQAGVEPRLLVLCALLLPLLVYIIGLTNFVRGDALWFRTAYVYLFVPALVALTFRLVSGQRGVAAVLALAAIGATQLRAGEITVFATDVVETNLVRQWRDTTELLPRDQPLYYLGRAGPRGLVLPLYARPLVTRLAAKDLADTQIPAGTLYYRSSLCATPDGRDPCRVFEHAHRLTPLQHATLPNVASQPWLPYPNGPLEVMLFKVDQK